MRCCRWIVIVNAAAVWIEGVLELSKAGTLVRGGLLAAAVAAAMVMALDFAGR